MNKNWKKLGALFLIVTLVAVSMSACIGGGEEETTTPTTTPVPTFAPTFSNDLPEDMNADWKTYFENTDFDEDGVLYTEDQYLGRNDGEVDPTKIGGAYRTMTAEISDFDPIDVTDTASDAIVSKIFDGLVQYAPGTTDPMPCIARAWEIDEEGKVYTFYLREGLEFTNGEALTAEDFVFSWDRLSNPVYASARINFLTDYVESYQALDDYTFEVTLKQPFAPFLTLMTYTCFKVVPKDYVSANEVVGETAEEGVERNWLDEPIGSGAWTLKEYVSGDHLTLEANETYWAGRPYLNEYRISRFTEEDVTIVQAWMAGQVDITGIPGSFWEAFNENYADQLYKYSTLSTYYMYFNCAEWPFDNVAIRQAMTCGIERESILNTVFKGRHTASHGILPPGLFGFSHELYDSYDWLYDPAKANQILDDAGIVDTNGDGIREYQGQELKIELSSYESDDYKEAAKTWIDNCASIGIELTYQQYDFGTILQMSDEGDYTLLTLGWIADYPDPENFFILFETKGIPLTNGTRYSNEQYDEWLQELRTNPVEEERLELCYNLEEHIQNACPGIFFFHPSETAALQTWVNGYTAGPMGSHVEKYLGVWIDEEKR